MLWKIHGRHFSLMIDSWNMRNLFPENGVICQNKLNVFVKWQDWWVNILVVFWEQPEDLRQLGSSLQHKHKGVFKRMYNDYGIFLVYSIFRKYFQARAFYGGEITTRDVIVNFLRKPLKDGTDVKLHQEELIPIWMVRECLFYSDPLSQYMFHTLCFPLSENKFSKKN